MARRHKWVDVGDGGRWRQLDTCAHCGVRKWLIQFVNAKNQARQTPLYAAPGSFGPWWPSMHSCTGHQVTGGRSDV